MTNPTHIDLRDYIRDVPDFPKPGIMFKDITPLLGSPHAFNATVDHLSRPFAGERGLKVAAIESRGFIFGAAVAQHLGAGFVPIRKPGKLPWKTHRSEYALEYGTDALEIHEDAMAPGDRVIVIDDVLATGGTASAAGELVRRLGAEVVAYSIVIELTFLNGRDRLGGTPVNVAIHY
ncbi:MAG: adenine phosphoribosyltransferase [Thermoanaerobaculia bacterium]|nr:adenine phosphoribosyltransferase [Thermoanaerobaculia bacterium]